MKGFLYGILVTVLVVLVVAGIVLARGYMEFRADTQPSWLEKKVAMAAVDASTDRHSEGLKNPLTASDENLLGGAKIYHDDCSGCHGDPAHPESNFGKNFYPPAPQFFQHIHHGGDEEAQNFYIVAHGIRWTGMPAWSGLLNEQQMWQVTTLLGHMESLPPAVDQELRKTSEPAK